MSEMMKKPVSTKTIGIIGAVFVAIVVVISIVASIMRGQAWERAHVEITGIPNSIPKEQIESLELQLKNMMVAKAGVKEDEKVKATIRDGSYSEKTDDGITTAEFLIDVDAFQQTYIVSVSWSDTKEISDGIVIKCPSKKQSKYPDSFCKSMYNTTTDVENIENNPIYEKLPIEVDSFDFGARRAIHYEIRGAFNEEGTLVLTIVDYSGGQKENAISKIKSYDTDIDKYIIKYFDDSGGY